MMAGLPDYIEITKVRVRKDMYLALAFGEFGRIVPQFLGRNRWQQDRPFNAGFLCFYVVIKAARVGRPFPSQMPLGRKCGRSEVRVERAARLLSFSSMQKSTRAKDLSRDKHLLEALLDSWKRNNRILVNLLRSIPEDKLNTRVMVGSPTIAELVMHIHYVRLVFVDEDVPEVADPVPNQEWQEETNRDNIVKMLDSSTNTVLRAVKNRLESGRQMEVHYDHPILMLQHMIWHEGYHHGQIKLALKLAGHPFRDEEIGPLTWGVWMNRSTR